MPLNVEPLSPARRAALVIFLALCFLASLGFAQILVSHQSKDLPITHPPVATNHPPVSFQIPPGFTPEPAEFVDGHQPIASFRGLINGSPRHIYFFLYPITPTDADTLEREAAALYVTIAAAEPEKIVDSTFGDYPALTFTGHLPHSTGFLRLRAALVGRALYAIVYKGESRITEEDALIFLKLVDTPANIPANE